MTDNPDLTVGRLQELLRDLATRKPIKQAIIAVESSDRSFRWIGAKGETAQNRAEDTRNTSFNEVSINQGIGFLSVSEEEHQTNSVRRTTRRCKSGRGNCQLATQQPTCLRSKSVAK